jgi:hypothetical protein
MALMDSMELAPADVSESALRRRFGWQAPGELARFQDPRLRVSWCYVAYGDMSTGGNGPVFVPGAVCREALVVKGGVLGPGGDPTVTKLELAAAIWEHAWGNSRGSQVRLMCLDDPVMRLRGV